MESSQPRSFAVFYVIGTVLLVGAGGVAWKYFKNKEETEAAQAKEKASLLAAGPSVVVAKAQRGPTVRKLNLVGEAVPLRSTILYSKVGGYLTRINVDVGDVVKSGQVLAEIQAPEIDAQITTIATGLENKRRLAQRARELHAQGFFSQQSLDNADNDVRVAQAQIAELRTQAGFRTVKAPFNGVVTNRYVDPGALVTNATNNQTSAQPLVAIADTTRLKVTVYAEQAEAPVVKPGLDVEVVDAAAAERKVTAKITRVSGELDARTRTRRAEVEFDGGQGQFLPGSFVNVAVQIPATSFIEVPAGALVTKDKKTFVATVDTGNKVHYTPIVVASTDGKVLRVASGLDEGTTVAVSPPAGIADGAKINPQQPPGAPKPPEPPKTGGTPAPGAPAKP
ncbi:MAG: efflux RND transporter periplasmic adaptor subunit [Burkholderiales bacterium]